ncbi:MAG: 30S ribosome-binding factor RbfA [Sinomicrobium sp.]|nr:30S ribosome-binding factor RbfA [Sinomicrobium sp.]
MESNRQQKIARLIQRDLAEIFRKNISDGGVKGILISVTKVSVTTDLALAKVYLSIFPVSETWKLMEEIVSGGGLIRHELAQRIRHQLRKIPELQFLVDDSLDYIEKIENSLKGVENPVENPELLIKRKKL